MQKTAIISDIHANLEAFKAVLEDIEREGLNRIYCLGDLVGYGPDPIAVIKRAMDLELVLCGNHDRALVSQAFGFNPLAREAIDWTRSELQNNGADGGDHAELQERCYDFLTSLPETYKEEDVLFVHGSPRDPVMEYLMPSDCNGILQQIPSKITDNFSRIERLCFFGHTHKPGVITEDSNYLFPEDLDYRLEFDPDKKYMVNVGSVGQPRDGDSRACYVISDGTYVEYRRVEYNLDRAQNKIKNIEALDDRLAGRLAAGE